MTVTLATKTQKDAIGAQETSPSFAELILTRETAICHCIKSIAALRARNSWEFYDDSQKLTQEG